MNNKKLKINRIFHGCLRRKKEDEQDEREIIDIFIAKALLEREMPSAAEINQFNPFKDFFK